MIVKGKYKYQYSTINLRTKVAKRFRLFSKKIAKSHSEALSVVMDFFEWHGYSPSDRFEQSVIREVVKNRKRTEASIAIIRDIEKNQTMPTNAMLHSLFTEKMNQDNSEIVELKTTGPQPNIEKDSVPKIRHDALEEKMKKLALDFDYVLGTIKTVKGSFGKSYLKIELSKEEVIKYKRNIKKYI